MKWIFFAYGLFVIATVLRYLPLGGFGLSLRLGNAAYGMSLNLAAFSLLLAVGSSIILVQVAGNIINVTANARVYRPYQAVEEKARLLEDNNQDTYRALADEIFKAPHGLGIFSVDGIGLENLPAPIANVIKDRLVHAEMQYRQGTGRAVREQNIVDVTNLLVQKLELPDYVRASPSQVRYMRMALITWNPTFMGKRPRLENQSTTKCHPCKLFMSCSKYWGISSSTKTSKWLPRRGRLLSPTKRPNKARLISDLPK